MKRWLIGFGVGFGVVGALLAFMSHAEFDMIEIPCRTCSGTGDCQRCGGDDELRKTCWTCYTSGNCPKCGGTKVEIVSRQEAERLGYR